MIHRNLYDFSLCGIIDLVRCEGTEYRPVILVMAKGQKIHHERIQVSGKMAKKKKSASSYVKFTILGDLVQDGCCLK